MKFILALSAVVLIVATGCNRKPPSEGAAKVESAFKSTETHVREFAEQAVEACLKLLEMHNKKRRYYTERWRTTFNIRIGVNTGYAHLGFFPNERRGTYTALGGTVNLAARLCSMASPNSVCVTKHQLKRVADGLPRSYIELKSEDSDIKGFGNEKFELYTIKPLISEKAVREKAARFAAHR